MEAIESAHILAVRAGLTTPTMRIGSITKRKFFALKNYIPVVVGHRYLRRRDRKKLIPGNLIHHIFLIGNLPGAAGRIFIYKIRHLQFGISLFSSFIQEI